MAHPRVRGMRRLRPIEVPVSGAAKLVGAVFVTAHNELTGDSRVSSL